MCPWDQLAHFMGACGLVMFCDFSVYKSLTFLVTFITRYLIPLDTIALGIVIFTHSLQLIPLAFKSLGGSAQL